MSRSTLERAREGHVPSISQLISRLESGRDVDPALRARLHASGGSAHVIGITGAPGSGKSTFVNALATVFRERGGRVGILAVDPSSSITGGSILGDRIRMQAHTLDDGVYVRSMSSRGALGGASRATVDAVSVLDLAGYGTIIVETVGAGQSEVEIIRIAQTTLVVSVPGLGDDVQTIKAGLLEVADIHVVNKMDRPEGERTVKDLVAMLALAMPAPGEWTVPVLGTVATSGEGVAEVADAIDAHLVWLRESGTLREREGRAARARIRAIVEAQVLSGIEQPDDDRLNHAIDEVVARRLDPHRAAAILIDSIASNSSRNGGSS